jgi:hypothetical protein
MTLISLTRKDGNMDIYNKNLENWNYISVATNEEKVVNGLRVKTFYKKYHCTICGEVKYIASGRLKQNLIVCDNGCHGAGKDNSKTIQGINDLATTHPYLIKYFVDREQASKFRSGSTKRVDLKCPNCGFIKNMMVNTFVRNGFACPQCEDGVSYPEKFVLTLLRSLNIHFIYQATKTTLKWCGESRYDFYIPSLNMIIETHGGQHYHNSAWGSVDQVAIKDEEKEKLALRNKIKHYIVLDCRKSEPDFIKTGILNSDLSKFFDLNEVDWKGISKQVESSLLLEVCSCFNLTPQSPSKIAYEFGLSRHTIMRYLKRGTKLGFCNYYPKTLCFTGRPVVMVDGEAHLIKKVYPSLNECAKDLNYSQGNLHTLLKGERKRGKGYYPFINSQKLGGLVGFYYADSKEWQEVKHLYSQSY